MKTTRTNLFRLGALATAAGIFILSSFSTLPMPPTPLISPDKLAHFIVFGALAFYTCFWFEEEEWKRKPLRTGIIVFLLLSIYGASDEFHQYFVPGRQVSFWDWVADSLGAVGGIGVFWAFVMVKK